MPVSAETLRLLMQAGVEGEELLRIVESIDRQPSKERTANAERQARFRAKKKAQGVTNNVTNNVTESVTEGVSLARVEDNLLPEEITGKEDNKKKAASLSDVQAFRAELSELDAERLDAIVKHRRSKKGQLTALSARLFVKDATACSMSLSEAVDACISRGWLTVKPEYFAGRKSATAPPRRDTYVDAMNRILEGRANGTENLFGTDGDAQRLPADGKRQGIDVADVRGGLARRFIQGSH
jgi:hypothetical protein